MTESAEQRTHRLNKNRGNGVESNQFGRSLQAEAAPARVLLEAPYWENGGMQHGVDLIESPISDRERNYSLTFASDGGYISVNPHEFGIASPDTEYSFSAENDRLYIGSKDGADDTLTVQYCYAADSEYLSEAVADLSEEDLKGVEDSVLAALRKEFGQGVDVEYSSGGDRWDDVTILFNSSYDGAERESNGRLSAFTSNIMAELEDDEQYIKVRNGVGESLILEALGEHGVG